MALDEREIDAKQKLETTILENDKKDALNEVDITYGNMISDSDKYYNDQIEAAKDWAETQKDEQEKQLDFTIDTINQQKEQTKKDYLKEQTAAYTDYQKQINPYGANAEQMAAAGLTNSGYSESSKVSMYNTYQNRVASAKESFSRAVLNYDNAIKEAQLQNSSILAEIAYEALRSQLEISLQGFQYKNTLILEKAKAKREIESEYNNRYSDLLNRIYQERALAEEARQFDEQLAEEQRQFNKLHPSSNVVSAIKSGKKYASGGNTKSNSSNSGSIKQSYSAADLKLAASTAVNRASTAQLYNIAKNFVKGNNLSDGGQRLLNSAEWSKAKRTGIKGSELSYNSYREYVLNYLYWRIDES